MSSSMDSMSMDMLPRNGNGTQPNPIEEIGRTELTSDQETALLTLTKTKRNILIRYFIINVGSIRVQCRFNGDLGDNYAELFSENFGAATSVTNDDDIQITDNSPSTEPTTGEIIFNNIQNQIKTGRVNNIATGGSTPGSAPDYKVNAFKWVNTVDVISSVNFFVDLGGGDMGAGSYFIALGWD